MNYLKVGDIAELLNVSPKTVTRWIQSGKLAAIKFDKDYRVKREDLDKFIEDSKVNPTE